MNEYDSIYNGQTALQLVDILCDNASKEWCDLIHALHETAHAEGVAEGEAAERERKY